MALNGREMVMKFTEMAEKVSDGQETSGKQSAVVWCRKWSETCRKWSEMVRQQSEMVCDRPEMVGKWPGNGLMW